MSGPGSGDQGGPTPGGSSGPPPGEGPAPGLAYATVGVRLVAYIIDGIILYGAFKLLSRRMPHKTDEFPPASLTSENEPATLI